MNLNRGQTDALECITRFLASAEHFYVLCGYAGTGKTFLMQQLISSGLVKAWDVVFTAPTNKATKVLRHTLGSHGAETKTIYSLLGIKMVSDEDRMVLEFPSRIPDISLYRLIVIDEASMVNKDLLKFLERVSEAFPETKFLYVGDPAQLGPVGERISPIWKAKYGRSVLTEVERNDSQLLVLATHIREQLQNYPNVNLRLHSDHDAEKGVWKYGTNRGFINSMYAAVEADAFRSGSTRLIAWRNKSVEEYNRLIRNQMFKQPQHAYVVGDLVMVAQPVQKGSRILAHIDDEGIVVSCDIVHHTEFKDFDVYRMTVRMEDGRLLELNVIHENSEDLLTIRLNALAVEAKKDKSKWGTFWALRNSFDRLRYGYAYTSHRSQGSTIENAFVDSKDILLNSNVKESIRSLYVASTRMTTRIMLR